VKGDLHWQKGRLAQAHGFTCEDDCIYTQSEPLPVGIFEHERNSFGRKFFGGMIMEDDLLLAEERMEKAVAALKHEYSTIRAGRANPGVLEKIRVDYYGSPTPIQQMAAVAVAEARVLTIQPWDQSTVRAIEKAIQNSDIGINPQSDGRIIRLIFPQLTEDHRKQLAKDIRHLAEEAKVSVRGTRREAIEHLKKLQKASELTEDDLKDEEKQLQDLTDKYCKNMDQLAAAKQKEIMEI
jgi:ribosome recycling factor